ncbi:MAG TPA: WbqC family protein [Kofleriaceae bacterium]|nr:WbqC family protein [Kofleriaceae bacterium]
MTPPAAGPVVAVLQSNYLPWKGYFDIIRRADQVVFYDDVQFTRNDWRSRNRIKTSHGLRWLSVPVGTSTSRRICDVVLPDHRWQRRHHRTLVQEYGRAPAFELIRPLLDEGLLSREWTNLSDLNTWFIRAIAGRFLGLTPRWRDSRDLSLEGSGADRLLQLLLAVGARRYVSGPAGRAYIDEAHFAAQGIEIEWMDYSRYPEYPQLHPPFEHAVSVVDLLAHVGAEAPRFIRPVPD